MMIFAFFAIVLLLVTASLIAGPLIAPPAAPDSSEAAEDLVAAALKDERRRLLDAIRELDADLASGKLSAADHGELRASYALQAASAMEQLEEYEREVAVREEAAAEAAEAASADAIRARALTRLEEEIAARAEALRPRSCPRCGVVVDAPPETHSCGEPAPREEAWHG